MKGIITEIQRFSLRDGPGIRTTVFFKGCNMACAWCHNPETLGVRPQRMSYPDRCIGCGACIAVCPTLDRAEMYTGSGANVLTNPRCTDCGACVRVCHSGAIQMAGAEMTVGQVMEEIVQDKAYYLQSGGGVTLSGGECTVQMGFLLALLAACRDEGIQTAIETNLLLPWAQLGPALALLDLVMFDIKLMDPGAHRKWTGAGNETILSNARRVAEGRFPYIVRTPLVPGVNDSEAEIAQIAGFLGSLSRAPEYYELLRFNPLGAGKYGALGLDDPFAGARPQDMELAERLKAAAESGGLPVRIE